MSIFWYIKQKREKKNIVTLEFRKLLIKSLLSHSFETTKFSYLNSSTNLGNNLAENQRLYFWTQFLLFEANKSISFLRRYCVFTAHSRSVSQKFKLCRQQARFCASNGLLSGLRKASF